MIQVRIAEPDKKAFGELTGKVTDSSGRPIPGVLVALVTVEGTVGSAMSAAEEHQATTDAQGSYRLRMIPRTTPAGKPLKIQLAITKQGYAGLDTRPIVFQPAEETATQVAETITLVPGTSVSGTVVDSHGTPLAGVWIEPGGSYANRSQFTKSDDAGRFTVRDLPEGMVALGFYYGDLMAQGKYFAQSAMRQVPIHWRPGSRPRRLRGSARARSFSVRRRRIGRLKSGPTAELASSRNTEEKLLYSIFGGPGADHASASFLHSTGCAPGSHRAGLSFLLCIRPARMRRPSAKSSR
jgi:hypothetical protein